MSSYSTVSMVGVPLDSGSPTRGCLMGPDALRVAGLTAAIEHLGYRVEDHGNLGSVEPAAAGDGIHEVQDGQDVQEVAGWTCRIRHHLRGQLKRNQFPLLLGGDHAMAIGSVTALAEHAASLQRPLFVLWLDAHTDFNTFETSPTGNVHGMPVACFCGLPGFEPLLGGRLRHAVQPRHVLMMGIRSVDNRERQLLSTHGIQLHDMRAIDEYGVVAPLRRFLERVRACSGLLHVSLDVDFLDPQVAPGVGTAVPGGVTLREAHLIMEMIYDSGLMTSLEVAELNPALDVASRTAAAVVELLASALGRRVCGGA